MGVSCLYGEGGGDFLFEPANTTVLADSKKAADIFMELESRQMLEQPFTWILVRPPWSSPHCSKARVFDLMRERVEAVCQAACCADSQEGEHVAPGLAMCVAKVLLLLQQVSFDLC
jgi:hypothetical protein